MGKPRGRNEREHAARIEVVVPAVEAGLRRGMLVIQLADNQFTCRGRFETFVHKILDQCVVENYLNLVVLETRYTKLVSLVDKRMKICEKFIAARKIHFCSGMRNEHNRRKSIVKCPTELNQELRQRILDLSGVTERPNAGIHEDAFFVGRKMFMHIHGAGHCDIRLSQADQGRVLADGRAQPHRWAPEEGYVTVLVHDPGDLEPAFDVIRMSHRYFAGKPSVEQTERQQQVEEQL